MSRLKPRPTKLIYERASTVFVKKPAKKVNMEETTEDRGTEATLKVCTY